ncbi:MAG: hypothetical protein V3W34_01925 [Phycisphaerae bacterium]
MFERPGTVFHKFRDDTHRYRLGLGLLVLSCGVQAVVTQSLLLREALVLMFGSEFAWGLVLFAWLFGVAVGAILGGWAAERVGQVVDLPSPCQRQVNNLPYILVAVLMALSVAACAELWIFRGARAWLGVQPGEYLPLPKTALAAMLLVSPASALVGMAFPLACRIRGMWEMECSAATEAPRGLKPAARGLLQLGNVYAIESAGSLIGGAVFSFWAVEHLAPIQTALCCGAVTAAASAVFLFGTARKPYASICLAAVAVAALLVSIFAGDALNRQLVHRRWQNIAPGYELCAEAETRYQNLAVGRREDQFTLYSDGRAASDFPDPYTFVPLAHFWLCQHPDPRNVLVLGGGAEGLLAEILLHPVEHVDYLEPDPRQIELIEPYLTDRDRQALTDARVTVHHRDARYFVKTQAVRFDLVIARLPEPMSALHARLYTEEFYRELRRAMRSRAVLCMTVAATPARLSAASAEYLASIRATLRKHFPHVTIGWGNPAQVLAATQPGLISTDRTELARRYSERGVQSEFFHPDWFDGATDWLDPEKLQQRAAQIDAADNVEISTDLRPAVYLQRLALWEQMAGGQSPLVIGWLRSIGPVELITVLLAIAAGTLLTCYLRARLKRSVVEDPRIEIPRIPIRGLVPTDRNHQSWLSHGAVVLSIGTTGFVTMALSIVWLFAFQNLYGYVYQRIGWIVALFMGGLVVGCWVVGWRSRRVAEAGTLATYLWRWLVVVDVLLALLSLAVPLVLPALGRLQSGPLTFALVEWCVSIMVAVTGVLGGAAFALAGALQIGATGRTGAAAGSLFGADHAGACLGALLSGILLVPVFGTAAAACLLAGVKLSSAALLAVTWRLARHN